jgi:hypothetical protein
MRAGAECDQDKCLERIAADNVEQAIELTLGERWRFALNYLWHFGINRNVVLNLAPLARDTDCPASVVLPGRISSPTRLRPVHPLVAYPPYPAPLHTLD